MWKIFDKDFSNAYSIVLHHEAINCTCQSLQFQLGCRWKKILILWDCGNIRLRASQLVHRVDISHLFELFSPLPWRSEGRIVDSEPGNLGYRTLSRWSHLDDLRAARSADNDAHLYEHFLIIDYIFLGHLPTLHQFTTFSDRINTAVKQIWIS